MILFTDTDTDITPEEARDYGFNLIYMPYTMKGVDNYCYKDSDYFDFKEFYNNLRKGVVPTTSALNSEEYKAYFRPFLEKGEDIFYIHFSRSMTVSFDAMDMAIKELKAEYPNVKFYSIDKI